ncbi:recombinase family protein [Thiocapsa imhoffii]|uniref:recombinase family protein n=1 Tax=Thiocapsa imhoffii TaxID=382777 RepID=UPI0023EE7D34|nr:recombinase family protein [Thiocapsa imhoffii]
MGRSGASAEGWPGFQRLMSEVGLDHVGIVLGIKISRLARSSRDWYQLLEVCGLFGDPDRDADGIYDSQNYNDRLLLGLKGTMSCCRSLCFTAQFPNYFVRNARGFPH